MAKLSVRFLSLVGSVATVKTEEFSTTKEALAAVKAYVEPQGFTRVKLVDDNDFDELRVTATAPGGRAGRNVASIDISEDY